MSDINHTYINKIRACRVCLVTELANSILVDYDDEWPKLLEFCTGIQSCSPEKFYHNVTNIKTETNALLIENMSLTHNTEIHFNKKKCTTNESCDRNDLDNDIKVDISSLNIVLDDVYVVNDNKELTDSSVVGVKNETKVTMAVYTENTGESSVSPENNKDKCIKKESKESLRCRICNRIYEREKWFLIHIEACKASTLKKPHNNTKKTKKLINKYWCGLCKFTSASQDDVNLHFEDHVLRNDLKCEICDFVGFDFADSVAHRLSHSTDEYTVVPGCPACQGDYRTKLSLQFHYRSTHLNKPGGYCPRCNRYLTHYKAWKRHMCAHMEKKYICDICGARFLLKNKLQTHIILHMNITTHICHLCGKGFKRESDLSIGSLKDYYLLSHHEIHKRSTEPSHEHHRKLNEEPQVRWFEQQRERRRVKRDYNPYDRAAFSQLSRRLPAHRTHHRALSTAPYFPDPLYKEQWYLNGGAKDGLDMNVVAAWQKGYTGKGVVVSILDDGIQTNHPDLAQNYDPLASTDINGNDDDPMPQDNGDNKHGTRCAGEVAGVAYNQYCGVGIAYNASIGGVRMLDGVVNDAVEARALGLNPDHIDIYSASWGPEDDGKTVDGPGPLARRAFIYGVTSGRRGKGSIFVWASGNGGRHTDSCNCDGYTNSIFTLSISSATQGGYKPWYLEECSSTLASTYSSGTPGHDKSVATVDMDGRLRADHICTVEHTGTSASAPLAAGICALALEANPNLTWRDMQYLVVLTSRSQPLERESGWIVNGVKRKVSHKFGYGLMDATEMVNLAEQWVAVPPQHICKSQEINEDKSIESTFGYTLTTHMDVNGCSGTVNEVRHLEHVQCKISLRFFPRGNLRIILKSPMGTLSTLLFERPRDVVSSNFDDWPFLSVHFWGEHAEGRWTLQIVNAGNRHVNQPGILKKWQLIFYGTAIDPIRMQKRPSQLAPPFSFPTAADGYDSIGDSFYNTDAFANYQNFPSLFAAGSDPEKAVARLDGHNVPSPHGENVLADSNDKRVVHECDPECDSQGCYGKGPTQCIACKHYRLDDACVSRCPPRSYANQGGVCWPCHESCETCVGPGQDSCLTCAPAHLLVADLAVCLQQCPDGYWEDSESSVCRPCAAHCETCSERADVCTSCDHHLVLLNGSCSASCPPSHYETEDYMCSKCHNSCDTCEGPKDNQCVSCHPSNYASDGRCITTCPNGFYADKKRKECMRCPVGCATCTSAFCLTCESNWELNKKGKCMPAGSDRCASGEFTDGQRCRRCNDACDSCYGENDSHCLTCLSPNLVQDYRCVSECSRGYYPEAGRCARCVHGCMECVSRLNCTACMGALRLQSGSCRTSCADGYYADRGTCSPCYLSCRTCIGPRRDQCASCPPGWRLAAGECHPECPQGFYQSMDGCRHCHHYCRECSGSGPLHCTSCPPRFMLDGGLCMECLGSQYYEASNGTCRPCDASCRTCSGPGQFSCTGCSRPLRIDRLNNQCVQCCVERGTATSTPASDCCHCHPETGECINSSVAGKRRIAEWGALHTATSARAAPSVAAVTLTVCVAAAALFLAVLMVLQWHSPREKSTRSRGIMYSPVALDDGEVTVLKSSAVPASGTERPERGSENEHESLLEHST